MEKEVAPSEQQAEKLKVLIADDNAPTRMLLRAAIKQWGYDVVEAADGEQAWDVLQTADAPWLLVLDWLMPRLDGAGLAERIRKELSYHPYIILLTQMTGTENIIKGLDAGADEFLSKPFNMAELRSRLSVGARIIKNEKALAKQKLQLQYYANQLKTISSYSTEMSQQIKSLLLDPKAVDLNKMQELQVILENLVRIINKGDGEE